MIHLVVYCQRYVVTGIRVYLLNQHASTKDGDGCFIELRYSQNCVPIVLDSRQKIDSGEPAKR